jgi:hypothetical protein
MKDWIYLNEEGMELFGDVFPDGKVPVISILPITFEHPTLPEPNTAFILKGNELSEETIQNLILKLAKKFKTPKKDHPDLEQEILNNRVPVRTKLTSGFGTSRPQMYSFDGPFENEGEEEI